ncbi:MAG: CehA/McbA family metallohydrolase [Chloroflexota bacterium]
MTSKILSDTRQTLLDISGHLSPNETNPPYVNHVMELNAENASRVGMIFTFEKAQGGTQIFPSLFAPDGFRGCAMDPVTIGEVTLELWTTPVDASEGALIGPLSTGEWRVQLDVQGLEEEVDYHVVIYAEFDEAARHRTLPSYMVFPENHVVKSEAGWYKGELHAHSTESDGACVVGTVIRAAINAQLDFFALTEHFTTSQWRKLIPYMEEPIALLRSCEITSHRGHANMHGLQEWVDVFVDDAITDKTAWSMNDAADAVHAQGGLFCVNHPFSGVLGWRVFDFDWSKADLMELYHNLENANNTLHVPLWDRQLAMGHRVVGVGGTDSHNPFEGLHKLGQVVTWVYADELSERGIVDGLRRGRVYVSRAAEGACPEMRFVVRNGAGDVAEMWETIAANGEPVTLEVQVKSEQPLRLFAMRDGYFLDMLDVDGGDEWRTYTFTDTPTQKTYYRIELHSVATKDYEVYLKLRDHKSVRALSNPVWVTP